MSISDPFLVPAPVQDDGSDTVSGSDEEEDGSDDEEAVIATLGPGHRRDTVRPTPASTPAPARDVEDASFESEDPLAAMDHLNIEQEQDGSSSLSDVSQDEDEDEEDEDTDSGEEDTEEEEEDEEDDELEVADDEGEGESSFAASTATASTNSDTDPESDLDVDDDSDDSAIGKSTARRRKTGSPIKKSRPSSSAPKTKIVPHSTTKAKFPKASSSVMKETKSAPAPARRMKSPLQEKTTQDTIPIEVDSDDEEEIIAVKTPSKKRYVNFPSYSCELVADVKGTGKESDDRR
jgi:hypothetical protein